MATIMPMSALDAGGDANKAKETSDDDATGVQMLMVAAEADELNDCSGAYIFHQNGIIGQSMDYRSVLLSKPKSVVDKDAPLTSRPYDHVLNQTRGAKVDPNWVLIDNQSTVDIFSNGTRLVKIRETDRCMHVYCNAGVTTTNLVGDLPAGTEQCGTIPAAALPTSCL